MQITPQNNSLTTRKTPNLANTFAYLVYKDSAFFRHKVIRALSNITVLCTVMVIISLKTILNEKVSFHFAR